MIAVQDRLLELLPEKIAYLAEDWGQLDFYNERPPVNFPCVLIDIAEAEFSDCTRKVQLGEAILNRAGGALRSRKHFSPRTEP